MFDSNLNFFDNKSHRTECDKKLRKLKNHFKPKDVLYKLELSPRESFMQSCPLELKPTKLSETSLDSQPKKDNEKLKKSCTKRKYSKRNESIPIKNIERKQESVDDSILTGLQTVIDLCGLLEKYEERDKLKHVKHRNKKKSQKQNSFNNSHELNFFSKSSGDSLSHVESRDSSKVYKPSNKPSQFRRLLARTSRSRTKNKSLTRCSNDSPTPDLSITPAQRSNLCSYNQSFQILNSSTRQSICSQTPPIEQPEERLQFLFTKPCCVDCNNPNAHAKNMNSVPCEECQTPCKECQISCNDSQVSCKALQSKICQKCQAPEAFCEGKCAESPAVVKASKISMRRRSQEDDIKNYWAKRNLSNQLAQAGQLEKAYEVSKMKNKKPGKSPSLQSITKERHSKTDSVIGLVGKSTPPPDAHKTEPTPHSIHEKRPASLSTKCFPPMEIVPATCHSAPPKITHKDHCAPKLVPHPVIFEPVVCNKDYTEPLKKEQFDCRKSRHGIPLVQPVVGYCTSGKCGGEHVKSIKYAMVKISEFISFNTYEIMKPYKHKPKNMPTCIAEIFVTSGRSLSIHRRRSCDHTPEITVEPCRHRKEHVTDVFKGSGTSVPCKEPPTCSKHSISQKTEPVIIAPQLRSHSVHDKDANKISFGEPTRKERTLRSEPTLYRQPSVRGKDVSKISVPPTILESSYRISHDPTYQQSVFNHKQPLSTQSVIRQESIRFGQPSRCSADIGSGQPVRMASTALPGFPKCEELSPIKPCSRQEIAPYSAAESSRISFDQSTKPLLLKDSSIQKSPKKSNSSIKKSKKSASKTGYLKSSPSKNASNKENTIMYVSSSGIQQSNQSTGSRKPNKHNQSESQQSFHTANLNSSNSQYLYHCVHIEK